MPTGIGTAENDLIDNRDSLSGTYLVGNGGDDIIYGGGRPEEIWGDSEFPQFNPPLGVAGFDQIHGGGNYDLLCDVSGDSFVEQYYGGGGADEFAFFSWYSGAAVDIVMDFQVRSPHAPGRPFDTLDVEWLLRYADPYWYRLAAEQGDLVHSYDPWAEGFLRLGQLGADTVLQFDLDGAAGLQDWQSIVRLKDVDASLFTGQSFSTYYLRDDRGPDDVGSEPHFNDFNYTPAVVTLVQEGGDGDDGIVGYRGVDIIHGFGGNDGLDGGDGNDVLEGGEGEDTLRGGGGFDTLDGGAGRDTLVGGAGGDVLRGGVGNDLLRGGAGLDRFELFDGDGQDIITDYANGDTIVFYADDVTVTVQSLGELKAAFADPESASVTVGPHDVLIAFAGGDSLTLKGVAADWMII